MRDILLNTVQYTSVREEYEKIDVLPSDSDFFKYQAKINPTTEIIPSHRVIDAHIRRYGKDYRFEIAPNPIEQLRNRRVDNTSVGRIAGAAFSTDFTCNK